MSSVERFLLDLFRTPSEPDPPFGAADSLRVFRASENYLLYRRLAWGVGQAAAIAGVVTFFVLFGAPNAAARLWGGDARWIQMTPGFVWTVIEVLEVLALIGLLAQIPISFFTTRLDYRYRWYMTTDRSIRIREGILNVREQTMMLSNVQNVAIRQGPLQRLLGIADVEVRSAGGGGGKGEKGKHEQSLGSDLHVCNFRGVSNAPEIRDLIWSRLRGLRDVGLGDPDDEAANATAADLIAAGQLLLEEARALRRAMARG